MVRFVMMPAAPPAEPTTATDPMSRILSAIILAAALFTAASAPATRADEVRLPDIGDSSGATISPDQERAIGESLMRRLRQALMIVDDPMVQSYIESLGYRLVAASDRPGDAFTFFVVGDSQINAFAAPGGYVGVNSGLILTSQSESELAAVLAHEITHVTQRHMARTYEAAGRQRLAAAVAILAAILVGGQSDQLAQAAVATGTAASMQMQLNFTRANEREADRLGIRMLANAGFDPAAMATFFERMQRAGRLYGARVPEFLSTHPVTTARIAESESLARGLSSAPSRESRNYELMRARLRVLTSADPAAAESEFEQNLARDSFRDEVAERYGYALALLANGKPGAALEQIEPLRKADPDSLPLAIAEGRIAVAAGQTERGLETFRQALLNYPNNDPLVYFYGEALLSAGQPARAREVLSEYLRNRSPSAAIHNLYARAAGEAGHLAEAYRHKAEYYFLSGQTRAAIDQLSRAAELSDLDFYQASQIEARLQELKRIALEEER